MLAYAPVHPVVVGPVLLEACSDIQWPLRGALNGEVLCELLRRLLVLRTLR